MPVYAADTIKISVNGTTIQFEQPPIMVKNTILAQIDPIAKAIGAKVNWKSETETATIIYKENRVALQIGNPNMTVLGQSKPTVLAVPPQMYNGKLFVPVEAIVKVFGYSVNWDGANKIMSISMPSQPDSGKLGDVLYSDITAYINGYAIPTSVIKGQTLVVAEDLRYYGFDVVWDGAARTLKVELNTNKKFAPLTVTKDTINKPGTVKCPYFYTDIITYVSGVQVESFAISGKTLINFELLKKYGSLNWNAQARELRLTIPVSNETKITYYKEFPAVPDFGKFFNMQLNNTNVLNKKSISYFYKNSSSNIINDYYALLKSCGFIYYNIINGDTVYKKDNVYVGVTLDGAQTSVWVLELIFYENYPVPDFGWFTGMKLLSVTPESDGITYSYDKFDIDKILEYCLFLEDCGFTFEGYDEELLVIFYTNENVVVAICPSKDGKQTLVLIWV